MPRTRHVKAATLPFALFVLLMILLMAGSLMLFTRYRDFTIISTLKREQTEMLIRSGITLVLAESLQFEPERSYSLSLFNDGDDTVSIQRQYHGFLEVIKVSRNDGIFSGHRRCFVGGFHQDEAHPALWLTDYDVPLCMSDAATITGDCFLPKAGYKPVYLNGNYTKSDTPVQGTVQYSGKVLIKPDLPEYYYSLSDFVNNVLSKKGMHEIKSDKCPPELSNSFEKDPIYLHSPGNQILSLNAIKGNVVVICDSALHIPASCKIEDAIIIATKIFIEKGFKGSGQFIAKDSLIVEQGCKLEYPSVVALMPAENAKAAMILRKDVSLMGDVYLFQKDRKDALPSVIIDSGAMVTACCFVSGEVELKGTLSGSLYAERLFYSSPSSLYRNYFVDGSITQQLPDTFVSTGINKCTTSKRVMKWVY